MRPRVFPAEDSIIVVGLRHRPAASMRPRVFPAEDVSSLEQSLGDYVRASMRPRVFPAEDQLATLGGLLAGVGASMRPRVFPAEDAKMPGQQPCPEATLQ